MATHPVVILTAAGGPSVDVTLTGEVPAWRRITSAKQYGFEPIPIFMLARYNVVIADDPAWSGSNEPMYFGHAGGE